LDTPSYTYRECLIAQKDVFGLDSYRKSITHKCPKANCYEDMGHVQAVDGNS